MCILTIPLCPHGHALTTSWSCTSNKFRCGATPSIELLVRPSTDVQKIQPRLEAVILEAKAAVEQEMMRPQARVEWCVRRDEAIWDVLVGVNLRGVRECGKCRDEGAEVEEVEAKMGKMKM